MKKSKKVISLAEAAKLSTYNQDYLGSLIRKGEIKAQKIGRGYFTTEEEVKNFLLKQKKLSPEKIDKVISLAEAAKLSTYNQDYLGSLIRKGEIKGEKIGRAYFTTEGEIQSFLLKQKNKHQETATPKIFPHQYARNILIAVLAVSVFLFGLYQFNNQDYMEPGTQTADTDKFDTPLEVPTISELATAYKNYVSQFKITQTTPITTISELADAYKNYLTLSAIISPPAAQFASSPAGPQGPQGIQGLAGLQGLQGPAGANADMSLFVLREFFSKQVDRIFDSIGNSMQGLSDSLANIINTITLAVSGDATIGGGLTVTGNITGNLVGAINPSFAVGSIPFQGASGLSEDNANLFWDDTNNRLGIGTIAPTANLQVAQGTAGVGTVSNLAGGTTVTGVGTQFTNTFKVGDTITINAETVAISAIASDTSMTTAAITGANSGVAYTLTGGTRFSVLGNGNVGIGTASPSGNLDVRQLADGDTAIYSRRFTDTTPTGNFLDFRNAAGSTSLFSVDASGALTVAGTTTLNGLVITNDTLTSNAQSTFTKVPTLAHIFDPNWPDGTSNASDGTIYINPASSVADGNLISAAVGDAIQFLVDAEGDIYANNLILSGSTTTGATTIAGNLTVQDNTTLGDAPTDAINFVGKVNSDITFTTDNTNDIGALEANRPRTGYFGTSVVAPLFTGALTGNADTVTNGVYTNAANSFSLINPLTTIAESWIGPSSTTGIYFKGGNVGIGTTGPSALLDLLFDSASSPNMLQVTNYRSGAAPNGAMTFRASRGTASVPVAVSSDDVLGGSYVYGHNGTSFLNMGNVLVRAAGATSAYLSLETKDTGDAEAIERVRILASGNVGIGTTVPDGKLHVMTASAGTVTAGADFDDLTVENSAEAGINILGGNANMVGIAFGDDGAAISGAVKYHNADNSMRFSVNGNLEKMRIQSDGNVGIGTTVPASKLDITTAGLATTQTTSSGLALVNTTAATAIAPVQISPAIRWSGFGWKTDATAASQAVDFRAFVTPVQGTSAPTGYLGFESSINGGAYSATPAFVITSAGNIGIGTTNPNRFLEVAGQAKIGDTAGEGLFLRGASTAAHYNWLIGEQVNVGSALEITPSTAAGGETFSTPVAVFLQSGNVGIGTTTPASLTEIQGGLTTTGSVLTLGTKETTVVVNDVLGRINFYAPLEADGSDAILTGASILAIAEDTFSATVNKTSLQFQTGASETATTKMTILSDGNVGIGVSPSYRLHVSDATTAGIVGAFTNSDGTCTLDPGDVGGWSCPSDERLKKDISNFDSGLAQINQLRPVSYRLKNENENTMLSVGLLAQEVQPIFPKLVTIQPDGTLSLNYGGLTPVVIKAIQELSLNLDGVAERVALLEANAGVSGSGESIAGTLGQYAVEFFSAGVSSVVDGVAYMKGIVVDKLTIGSAAKPVGFTIYDTVTSNPFCVSMVSGVLVSLEGTCESQNQISMTASDTTDTTTSSTPASSIDSAGQATTTEESAPADTTTSNVTTTDTTSDAITSDTTDTTTNSTDTITTEESASELTAVDETPPEAVAPPEETPPPETPTPEPAPEVVSEPSP